MRLEYIPGGPDGCLMVPVGNPIATSRNLRERPAERPRTRRPRPIQDRRADAAGAEMRPHRRADQVDRHVRLVEVARRSGDDRVAERLDVRADRVQDHQPLDRPLGR